MVAGAQTSRIWGARRGAAGLSALGAHAEALRVFRRLARISRKSGRITMALHAEREMDLEDPDGKPAVDIFVTHAALFRGIRGQTADALQRIADYEAWLEREESYMELAEARSARSLLLARSGNLHDALALATTSAKLLGSDGWSGLAIIAARAGERDVSARAARTALRLAKANGSTKTRELSSVALEGPCEPPRDRRRILRPLPGLRSPSEIRQGRPRIGDGTSFRENETARRRVTLLKEHCS
ncbi:hypothetical protein BH09MYX1_BH09MYX1_20160 [soil metagenome]